LPVEKFFPPEEGDLFQLLNRLTGESFPDRPYKPHIDGYVLDMAPLEALRQGRAAGIPLIAGATTQEAWGERLLLSDWNTFAQKVQQYLPDRYPVVIQDYRGRYSDPGEAWAYLVGNFVLLCPTLDAAKAQAAFAPTYAYIFDYRSEVFPEVGSFHGAEIPWLFGTQTVWPVWLLYLTAQALHDSLEAAARLQAYWIRFAQDSEPGGWPRWPQYNRGEVLYFNDLLGLRPDPYLARCGVLR
jgi:para-nitrobenzyl esterase